MLRLILHFNTLWLSGYPPDHINAVLTHTLHFLSLLAFYLGVKLPFDVVWSRSSTPPTTSSTSLSSSTTARTTGLLGVGTPWIGAVRGTENGGWARSVIIIFHFCALFMAFLLFLQVVYEASVACVCQPTCSVSTTYIAHAVSGSSSFAHALCEHAHEPHKIWPDATCFDGRVAARGTAKYDGKRKLVHHGACDVAI